MLLEKRIKNCLGSAGALGLLLTGANANADASDTEWLGIAYLWGSGITIDARDQSVGIDFKDLVDDLEIAFMGHVEAQGDKLGGFVDVVFVGVGSNESRPNADLNVDNDTTSMDLAVVWSPGSEPFTGLETYAGLRYISNDFNLVVDPIPPALPTLEGGIDESYYDALLGVRYITPVSDNWRLTFQGDLSFGDTEGTFSLGAYAGYVTGQHHFIAGYKHFEMDLESGNGGDLTVTMTGPVLAYGYRF
jgi:hypothetical protein